MQAFAPNFQNCAGALDFSRKKLEQPPPTTPLFKFLDQAIVIYIYVGTVQSLWEIRIRQII